MSAVATLRRPRGSCRDQPALLAGLIEEGDIMFLRDSARARCGSLRRPPVRRQPRGCCNHPCRKRGGVARGASVCGIWKRVIQAFRIRAKAHNPHVGVTGVSDHLDRGQWGEWLDPHAGKPAPAPPPRPGLRGSSGSEFR